MQIMRLQVSYHPSSFLEIISILEPLSAQRSHKEALTCRGHRAVTVGYQACLRLIASDSGPSLGLLVPFGLAALGSEVLGDLRSSPQTPLY